MQIVNLFLSRPSVYTLPGTWEKQPLIPHGHLGPGAGFALFLGLCLLSLVVYGIYMTFGSGGKSLKDEIKVWTVKYSFHANTIDPTLVNK